MQVNFPKDIYTEKISGVDFDIMYSETMFGIMRIKQKQYATIRQNYAVLFVVSFISDDDESELDKIMQTVRFK